MPRPAWDPNGSTRWTRRASWRCRCRKTFGNTGRKSRRMSGTGSSRHPTTRTMDSTATDHPLRIRIHPRSGKFEGATSAAWRRTGRLSWADSTSRWSQNYVRFFERVPRLGRRGPRSPDIRPASWRCCCCNIKRKSLKHFSLSSEMPFRNLRPSTTAREIG